MDLNKKYFGMTVMQLGILGGLGALALVLFCIVGVLVAKNGFGGAAAQQFPTGSPTLEPTVTLVLTPTQTTTPTLTPAPYESLITPGWVQQRTALSEIWLPTGYKAVKTTTMLTTGLGGSPIVDMALKGSYSAKSGNKIFVVVSYEPLTADTLDNFIVQRLTALGIVPSERSKTTLNSTPAVRLVFSGRAGNVDINELTYVVLDGSTVWYIQFNAEITDYFNSVANFESSAKTFRLVR